MSKRIALMTTALMLAIGAGGMASAATIKKVGAHPRSQASLQCSAEANAKGLHGKARIAFRRSCLRHAEHKVGYRQPMAKHVHHASTHKKLEKADKKA
ncbi:PsiF family protein [uncultured Hyphomicrobium sp.]|uniref:PsiF family protein n=1 Tax=uncultured Hyphomicrobium sp. TaxID=194373 RepID=UPI0025EC7117|nr:PsiF family protein [uncultured Hyphomicrobium sp.]